MSASRWFRRPQIVLVLDEAAWKHIESIHPGGCWLFVKLAIAAEEERRRRAWMARWGQVVGAA